MSKSQLLFMEKAYGFSDAVLFNSVARGRGTSINDVESAVKNWKTKAKGAASYIRNTIGRVNRSMPLFYKNLDRYLLFSDFVSGRRTTNCGFPVIPICETKHSIAFMSVAIPNHEDGHVLVVPRRRHLNIDDVPVRELEELIKMVALIGRAVRKTHGGYNVLLNNGKDAGQFIMHAHFHVIPRTARDRIKIEIWRNRRLTEEEYLKFNARLKAEVALLQSVPSAALPISRRR